jgi:phage repressor protein C with HTH and peptisase S24 domain
MREEQTHLSVNQRINFLIDFFEAGNKSAFGRNVDMKSGVVGDLVGGRLNKPSFDALLKILKAYPAVNTEWLVLGRGEPIKLSTDAQPQKTSSYKELQTGQRLRVLTVQVGPDNEENIEFVSQRAAAGYAKGGFMEQDFIAQLPHFRLPDAAYRNGSFRCFQVGGESMQSTLYNGDWVICRYIEEPARDIRDNRVYVVVTEEDVRVKRVLNRLNDPNRANLALQSDNAAFPVDFVGSDQVREVWEAVGRLSRQFVNPRYDVDLVISRHNAEIAELFGMVRDLKQAQ